MNIGTFSGTLTHIPKPLVLHSRMLNKIEIDGIAHLKAIANKCNNPDEAERSFRIFVSSFESDVLKFAEIHANKMGIPIECAFEATTCAFARVWRYPTFDINKAHCKNPNKGILVWLNRIAANQMYEYVKKNRCAQHTQEEDLSVIEDATSFVDLLIGDKPAEEKMEYVSALESRISCLGEKHRIIYLTYKAYDSVGKKLPRSLLEKLRKRLGITQATIRVYKKEALQAINDSFNE